MRAVGRPCYFLRTVLSFAYFTAFPCPLSGPSFHIWKWRKLRTRAIKSDGLKQGFSTGALGPPLGAYERFSGGHEQKLLLISSTVILQNPSVAILIIRQLKGKGGHKPWKVENHWLKTCLAFTSLRMSSGKCRPANAVYSVGLTVNCL